MIPIRNLRRNIKKAREFPAYAVRAALMRARGSLSYLLGRGWSAPPETVSLLLTYACNLRCSMCGQWGEGGSSVYYTPKILSRRLSLADIEAVITDLSRRRFLRPAVTLFGGEPLLYEDIIPAISLIKGAGLRVNIITNGTLLSRHARDIVAAGLDEIIFSLDGPPSIHDRVRGRDGVFEEAHNGFALLAEEKAKTGKKHPIVNVNSTIFDFNYQHLRETYETARGLGAQEVTFHHLIFIDDRMYSRHNRIMTDLFDTESTDWAGFISEGTPDIDPEILSEQIREVTVLGASVYPNLTREEITRYYTEFPFEAKSYSGKCKSPWMTAYIFPDKTVRPCLSMNVSMGTLDTNSFYDIWNNDRYRQYRQAVRRHGRFPACDRCTELFRF